MISSGWYSAEIDTPENRKFVEAVRAAYNADPGYFTAGAYTAAMVLDLALQAVKGDIEDKEALMKALRTLRIADSFRGPIRIDEHGNPILTVYIRKVERKDGRLVNTIIHTYPNVSQFWKYRPTAFLANPVYSRDFPKAMHLQ